MSAPDQSTAPQTASDVHNWLQRPAHRGSAHLAHVLFLALGIALIVGGYNSWAAVQPIAGGVKTTGTVVSVDSGETCGQHGCSPYWDPTISFTAANGAKYTFAGPRYSTRISVGDTVTVSYLPSNPHIAHDISASTQTGLVLIGVGVFALVLAIGSFFTGLSAVQQRTGLQPAREGSGWVGHKSIHSNLGALVGFALLAALVVVGFFVL